MPGTNLVCLGVVLGRGGLDGNLGVVVLGSGGLGGNLGVVVLGSGGLGGSLGVVLGSGSTVSSVISCIGIAPAPSITNTKVNMTQAFILIAVCRLILINKSFHFCNCYKPIRIEDDM